MAEPSTPKALLSVEEARDRILASVIPVSDETVVLGQCRGRTLARPIAALRTQPPAPMSAMDGYAVRSRDLVSPGATLTVIGASPAGQPFAGHVSDGQAVRIFTGGVVPDGADCVVIQEDVTTITASAIRVETTCAADANIRPAGCDFKEGQSILDQGTLLGPAQLALAAAGGWADLPVHRAPSVAILATGDELRLPGEPLAAGQIVASNTYSVAALVESMGGRVLDLGIVPDDESRIAQAFETAKAEHADLVISLGGASVGEHDLIRTVAAQQGMVLDFWKIAMRPGKPLIHGHMEGVPLLGLPGNPVSSMVCAHMFVAPVVAALQGRKWLPRLFKVRLVGTLPANGPRQHYARARIVGEAADGLPLVQPFSNQDSSLLGVLALADCLIVQDAHSEASQDGASISCISLDLN